MVQREINCQCVGERDGTERDKLSEREMGQREKINCQCVGERDGTERDREINCVSVWEREMAQREINCQCVEERDGTERDKLSVCVRERWDRER